MVELEGQPERIAQELLRAAILAYPSIASKLGVSIDGDDLLVLRERPVDGHRTRPDLQIRCGDQSVYVELKVAATLTHAQLQALGEGLPLRLVAPFRTDVPKQHFCSWEGISKALCDAQAPPALYEVFAEIHEFAGGPLDRLSRDQLTTEFEAFRSPQASSGWPGMYRFLWGVDEQAQDPVAGYDASTGWSFSRGASPYYGYAFGTASSPGRPWWIGFALGPDQQPELQLWLGNAQQAPLEPGVKSAWSATDVVNGIVAAHRKSVVDRATQPHSLRE